MKVLKSFSGFKALPKKTAVTIGVFDGMHKGHIKLLKTLAGCAEKLRGKSVVVSFRRHPDSFLKKNGKSMLIKPLDIRIKRIKDSGADILFMPDFRRVAAMEAVDFVKKIIVKKLNAGCVVVGRDFVFGKGGKGNVALLRKLAGKYGFELRVIADVKSGGKKISSTRIRGCLRRGSIKTVERLLGRKYSIEGRVEKGRNIGFEFPTANIKLPGDMMPAPGVWAVAVEYRGKRYAGAANIGTAPTLKKTGENLLEVFIIDFSGNLYNKKIRVVFLGKIRNEKKFKSREQLAAQVEKDVKKAGIIYKKRMKAGEK